MITVIDVVGRYFFDSPLPGGFELTEFLMAGIVYTGIPPTSWRDGHISVDLFDDVTPNGLVPIRQILVHTACTACFGVFAWQLFDLARQIAVDGDVTEYLRLPSAPVVYFGAALFAVAAMIHLGKLFEAARTLLPRNRRMDV
jgi:TRAP-type C4-dicarboxylate transport system permease small subunit